MQTKDYRIAERERERERERENQNSAEDQLLNKINSVTNNRPSYEALVVHNSIS